ncbi:MAG TPA: PEP-CTERM sorting domain-containing protein [Terriglobia bacterium]|nr:PEP-CTERM sorting domain-containing protein [Terriglobia bacterium]
MNFTRLLAVSALVLTLPSILLADPFGIDTFEDGTTQGWFVPGPHPVPPANIASGGPNGAGDNYLQVTALGGDGAGSRLSMQNISQWTGSFAHLSSVTMDVNNFGASELFLRFLFVNFAGPVGMSPPTDVAWTLAPVIVPSGSGWRSVTFDLAPVNLFAPIGSVAGALGGADELRLFHNPIPAFGGPTVGAPPVTAVLGIDNIAPVPEPLTVVLLGTGLVSIGSLLGRHRRKK